MSVLSQVSWLEVWQCLAILVAAFNAGASSLQGIMTMPLMMMPEVPVHYEAKQVAKLLHLSEFVFPPLNAFCLLSNIIMSFLTWGDGTTKSTRLAVAAASHILPTIWTLRVMAIRNKKMTGISQQLDAIVAAEKEDSPEREVLEMEFRNTQQNWRTLSYVRGVIMVGNAVAGLVALPA